MVHQYFMHLSSPTHRFAVLSGKLLMVKKRKKHAHAYNVNLLECSKENGCRPLLLVITLGLANMWQHLHVFPAGAATEPLKRRNG